MELLVKKPSKRKWPRKVNECFKSPGRFSLPGEVFDEFWREGELSLMFGPAGVGKSVLAVQIADAIARGRAIDGFIMPQGRRRVLYVDMMLRDDQFQARYSRRSPEMRRPETYKFADFLYRDRPPRPDDLCDWLEAMLAECPFDKVIIDSLSAVSRTGDGTRETLAVMRRLKKMQEGRSISILVLADSAGPGRSGLVSEADLKRSRVLCTAADSVFAIGHHPQRADERYIVQTRSTSAPVFWTEQNAPICRIVQDDKCFLRLRFDERFAPEIPESERLLICRIKAARDAGQTYRELAAELGVSRSHAARLFKKWTPAMGSEVVYSDGCDEEAHSRMDAADNTGNASDLACMSPEGEQIYTYEIDEKDISRIDASRNATDTQCFPPETASDEFETADEASATSGPQTIYDLKPGLNADGDQIFIESENALGQPSVWYWMDRGGKCLRYSRRQFAVKIEVIGRSPHQPV